MAMIRLAAILVWLAGHVLADPLLSVDITLAEGEDYGEAAAVILDMGADATSFSLMWDELETEPGAFPPIPSWAEATNDYFPTLGLQFTLTFSVIDTVADRRPEDLRDLPWDDPVVIARFAAHVGWVLNRMPDVQIIAIAVGNEVDAHLQTAEEVAAYARFLAAARAEIARLRPGVPVAAKLTFSGLTVDPARLQPIIDAGEAAFFTYYPFDAGFALRPPGDAAGDLDRMITMAQGKALWLLEAGYPSDGCGVPPDGQAEFVRALRASVATRADAVALVSFTFLTDLPEDVVNHLTGYYGVSDDCFRRYLSSLGLRQVDGTPKPGFAALAE
jgi:hypothetical protein